MVFQMFEVGAESLFGELFERFDAFGFIDVEELLGSWLVSIERE
jgi:hypothetical protein